MSDIGSGFLQCSTLKVGIILFGSANFEMIVSFVIASVSEATQFNNPINMVKF